ncbi:MAG: BatA domain-containing protein [Deltaproteobacteria bacterium]|nr:BatA domain-containing protein [Deltaproteobacteria bacterium]
MSLVFVNPASLFALAAGILPILIHRLTRRKARKKRFSAVRLLLESLENPVRPERLKERLLLALRVLAVLTLAFLVSRPVRLFPGVFSSGQEGAKILVLDNSLSMGYREDAAERFALAKRKAAELLEGTTGRILLLPTVPAEPEGPGSAPAWTTPEGARRELEAVTLSYGRGDPAAVLNRASAAWKASTGPMEVVFLTDLARADWDAFRPAALKGLPAEVSFTFLRFGAERKDSNAAVTDLRLLQGEGVVGTPTKLEAVVRNLSGRPLATVAELHLNGAKVDQRPVEVPPGEAAAAAFQPLLERSGWVEGEVRLAGDRLPGDDRFHFALKAREKVRVLVVDGDPRPALRASESYYVVHALRPGDGEGSPFLPRAIPAGELERADLKAYEALVLLNVADPPAAPLAAFLRSGKPLLLFLGDRVNAEAYRRLPFLPCRLGQVREMPAGGARLGRGELPGASGADPGKASFFRYYRLEKGAKELLRLANGDPLLVEGAWGGGRVFLWASSADTGWNDLPLHAAFLPVLQGLLKEAVGLSRSPLPPTLRIGAHPAGEGAERASASPGVRRRALPEGEARQGVNVPPEESDLGTVPAAALPSRFGSIELRVVESRAEAGGLPVAGRRELWPYVLGFLLAVLGAEMAVASRP